ncbi:hypothetical protein F4781DRAFT_102219 [Annulohypoxylon bovei var. microspora]|nr:hypothetical protein F4781DRAFT_102219 [Annulohypoxylon bovei var. microspora]
MSLRFNSDSIRKRVKAVRERFSPNSTETKPDESQSNGSQSNGTQSTRSAFKQRKFNSIDGTLDNLHLTRVKTQDYNPSDRLARIVNGRTVGYTNGRSNSHVLGYNSPESYQSCLSSGASTAKSQDDTITKDLAPKDKQDRKHKNDSNSSSGTRSTALTGENSSDSTKKSTEESIEKSLEKSIETSIEKNGKISAETDAKMLAEITAYFDRKEAEFREAKPFIKEKITDKPFLGAAFSGPGSSVCSIEHPAEPETVFKAWPDEELELQCRVIEKYNNGDRLWTRTGLRALEDQIKRKNLIVKIPAYVGKGQEFEKNANLKKAKYKVQFNGYRTLAFPPASRPDGIPYSSVSVTTARFDRVEIDDGADLKLWYEIHEHWIPNQLNQELYAMFMRLPLPPYINKIVCFDLGTVSMRHYEEGILTRMGAYRHLAALQLMECLRKRFGGMIRMVAQDTRYRKDCEKVLFQRGFEVVGSHGAAGLTEIDDRTLVFAPSPEFCLKEIVADIAQPAAMFCNPVLTPEETDAKTKSKWSVILDDNLTCHYNKSEKDPDSPRVREFIQDYDKHIFPETDLFGKVALYTRAGASASRRSEDTDTDTDAPDWPEDRTLALRPKTEPSVAGNPFQSLGYSF